MLKNIGPCTVHSLLVAFSYARKYRYYSTTFEFFGCMKIGVNMKKR